MSRKNRCRNIEPQLYQALTTRAERPTEGAFGAHRCDDSARPNSFQLLPNTEQSRSHRVKLHDLGHKLLYTTDMFNRALLILAAAAGAHAEVRPLTLRQTVALAVQQNPDVALARLDEEMARLAVRLAKDPFTPRVTVGSGLAYTYGFPMSVEGSAPSIVQARASSFIFNRQQNY